MATINRFEDLEIWKDSRKLSLIIYSFSLKELFSKDFRFRDQIKAAAGSKPSAILSIIEPAAAII